MSRSYAVSIEPDAPDAVLESLRSFLKDDNDVLGWWNHMPGLYLVTWRGDAGTLSARLEKLIKPWSFFVVRAELEDSQGWLPSQAWSWIRRRHAQVP